MSFQQGLSGLNGAAKSLDVIGNNIANASTVGFKGSQAQFADVYANSLNGGGGNLPGIGVSVAQIAQQFNQGNLESSANPLDIAINGAGFFRSEVNGVPQYGRNGQFSLDNQGFIVNAQGAKLTGLTVLVPGSKPAGSAVPLQINNADLKPVVTGTVNTALNLDARSPAIVLPFDASNPLTYTKQTSIDVYDSLGNSHVLSTFYVKTGPNAWDVYTANDGTEITALAAGVVPPALPPAAVKTGALTFDATGTMTSPASQPMVLPIVPSNGANPTLALTITFAATQYGSATSETSSSQDGYSAGKLTRFSAGPDGIIVGQYSNGQSQALGQIELFNFRNPNGLSPLGNNAWAATTASGTPQQGNPGSGSLGVLQSSSVESSNVDLTAELVNMITAQRVYQANAQTIKTQDSVLQTMVNLR